MGIQQIPGRSQLAAALVCLLGLGNVGTSQSLPDWNPVKTTCNMVFARAVVMEKTLYIDGGALIDQVGYGDGADKPYPYSKMIQWQNQHLWKLDLSQKFNVSTPPWDTFPKPENPEEHYNGLTGTLWNIGDGKFYTLGGKFNSVQGPAPGQKVGAPYYTQNASGYYFQLPDTRIFAYDPQTSTWSSQLVPKEVHRVVSNAYTQSARNKAGYMLGGHLVKERHFSSTEFTALSTEGGRDDFLGVMSTYDFRTNEFNMTPTPDIIGRTIMTRMHCLERVGNEGILVAFAGTRLNENTPGVRTERAMDEILIYDIATKSWMMQKATGDIPRPRASSCSVLVPAPDLSSFQFYVFAGITINGLRILDTYVLSIPAFIWTKIEMKNYPNNWTIGDMSCAIYEERQFIIIPGEVNVTDIANSTTMIYACNKDTGVHVFDTYDWEYKNQFDPENKVSKVPPTIFKLIGGNDTGGATVKQPQAGWDDEALGTIFSIRNELPPDEVHSPTQNVNSPPTGPPDEPQPINTPRLSAIIGGVVGGCVVVLIVSIATFAVRRSRKLEPNGVELHGEHNFELHVPSKSETTAELHGEHHIELHADENYELYAYEPPEIGSLAEGEGSEKEAVLPVHLAPSTSPASSLRPS